MKTNMQRAAEMPAPAKAVTTSATITAASHNTGYRDNLNAIWVYTTAGDISYATSGTALSRLAIGTARQVFRVNTGATAPEYGGAIGAKINLSTTAQSIANNTETDVSWNSEVYDTDGLWVVGSPTVLTLPYAGYWLVQTYIKWAAAANGTREAVIKRTSSPIVMNRVPGSSLAEHTTNASVVELFSAAQTVKVTVYQDSGGAVNVTTGSWISATWIGP